MPYWLVSLPLVNKRKDVTWELLQEKSSGYSTNTKLEVGGADGGDGRARDDHVCGAWPWSGRRARGTHGACAGIMAVVGVHLAAWGQLEEAHRPALWCALDGCERRASAGHGSAVMQGLRGRWCPRDVMARQEGSWGVSWG